MKPRFAVALLVLVMPPLLASAADLPVSYLVEEKPLKAAVAGTPLTFELYSDNTCTTLVQSVPVNVEDVTILAKLKQMTPKNDTKLPNTVELRHTLVGLAPASTRYLKVVGAGVVPVGGACQVQGPATVAVPVVKDATGAVVGTWGVSGCSSNSALFSSSIGPVGVGFKSKAGFFDCGYLFFTSTDCSGSPLIWDLPTIDPGFSIYPAFGINDTIYIPLASGAVSTVVNSKLLSVHESSDCAGPGQTFIPPHGCCCTAPSCPSSTQNVAPVQETLTFTPPFSIVFP